MTFRNVSRLGAGALLCAGAFCASDIWNTKDSSQWTSDDIDRILTNSPWAKEVKVKADPSQMGERGGGGMGRQGGGGGGGRGGGIGGIGLPGGIGFPGGGGGRGSGGMGGPTVPGGGGGRGGNRGGGMANTTATVRWDSARPVQEALLRSEPSANREKAEATPAPEEYIISVMGLRMPGRRAEGDDEEDSGRGSQRGGNRRERDPEQMRDRLISSTRLIRKNGETVRPTKVEFDPQVGAHQIQFFFPRTHALSMDDKEVTFRTQIGPMTLEKKFELKEMKYKGKLEL